MSIWKHIKPFFQSSLASLLTCDHLKDTSCQVRISWFIVIISKVFANSVFSSFLSWWWGLSSYAWLISTVVWAPCKPMGQISPAIQAMQVSQYGVFFCVVSHLDETGISDEFKVGSLWRDALFKDEPTLLGSQFVFSLHDDQFVILLPSKVLSSVKFVCHCFSFWLGLHMKVRRNKSNANLWLWHFSSFFHLLKYWFQYDTCRYPR